MNERIRLHTLSTNESGQYFTPVDTSLRDGAQSPVVKYSKVFQYQLPDKIDIIDGLYSLGVRNFELFSPVVSPEDREHFIALKEHVVHRYPDAKLLAHVRCHVDDITQALEVGADGLHIYLNASEFGQQYSHGMNATEMQTRVRDVVGNVRSQYPDLYLRYSSEDYFRTDRKIADSLFDVAAEYVNTLGVPDTVGWATPGKVRAAIKHVRQRYPDLGIECHFHNDMGNSLMNAEAAVVAGADYIDTSIWGLAERGGITSITSLLFRLYYRHPQYTQGFEINQSYPVNVLLGGILDRQVIETELVSATAVTHSAGVHSNAVLKNRQVYEGYDWSLFGVDKAVLLLNPYCGNHHIFYFLKDFCYYEVERDEAVEITKQFKNRKNEIGKNKLSPEELLVEIAESYGLVKMPEAEMMQQTMLEHLNGVRSDYVFA